MMMRGKMSNQSSSRLYQRAASTGYAGGPEPECLARWEDDGGRPAPPHLDRYSERFIRESSAGFNLGR